MERSLPNYKKIYEDIISKKCPEKHEQCVSILEKSEISAMDVLHLNDIVFGKTKESEIINRKHKSYDYDFIIKILEYQKKNKLTNVELSKHFNLSRNTISKWKKEFLC